MSDENPPEETPEENSEEIPEETPEETPEEVSADATVYAVYDNTLGQYIGTHPNKKDAEKAKTAAGKLSRHAGHKLVVRKV